MKLFIFPFAGGSKHSFNYMKECLPNIEIIVLEYPGRGLRMGEALLMNVEEVVEDTFQSFRNNMPDDDYVIYGHSLGGLIAYLVCQKIHEFKLRLPQKLIISGSKAPTQRENEEKVAILESAAFWEKINEMGGMPEELMRIPSFKVFFEPILKADFYVGESYRHSHTAKLNIPIDVFYGSEENFTGEQISAWEKESALEVNFKELEGNHFFIYKQQEFFTEYFNKLIKSHV